MKIKSKSGAVLGALIAAALVSASAATLNGLTTQQLGAETAVVAGCDDDGVDISYVTAYDTTSQAYNVTGVRLLGLDDACIGQLASVALDDGTPGGAVLTEEPEEIVGLSAVDTFDTDTDNGTAEDFVITLTTPVSAALVLNIAVVIA